MLVIMFAIIGVLMVIFGVLINKGFFVEKFNGRRQRNYGGDPLKVIGHTIWIITLVFIIAWSFGSYFEYTNAKIFLENNQKQYANCITLYKNTAILNLSSKELTDMKYSGYQQGVKDFIKDFRNRIVWYNKIVERQRIFNKGIIFNWITFMPDENMIPIHLFIK